MRAGDLFISNIRKVVSITREYIDFYSSLFNTFENAYNCKCDRVQQNCLKNIATILEMAAAEIETASGVFGAVCCVYTGLPFDVVKLRLQTQAAASAARPDATTANKMRSAYNGPLDCAGKIARVEGVRALWKGAIPAVGSSCDENAVVFTFNVIFRRALV